MMWPELFFFITGRQQPIPWSTPLQLISTVRSHSSMFAFSRRLMGMYPALLT